MLRNLFSKKKAPYTIEFIGRAYIIYTENDYKAHIDIEFLHERPMVIAISTFVSWLPPHESEMINDEVKDRVKANINKEFTKQGREFDWD